MTDIRGGSGGDRTRWRRFAAVAVPSVAAAGAMLVMTANGALAASFAVSGQSFKVSATQLDGDGFEQFGAVDVDKGGTPHPVAVSLIGDATLKDLCQSVKVPAGPLGNIVVTIKAGGGATPASAKNMVVDAAQLSGDATFTNMEIGRDASTLTRVAGGQGPAGMFGQQAEHVTIDGLQQTAWSTTAGTFKLNGLHLGLAVNGPECF
jgi:hypothetical protein